MRSSPRGRIGVFGGTAQKWNVDRRAGSVGFGRVNRISSRSPRADTPATRVRATGPVRRDADDVVEVSGAERARPRMQGPLDRALECGGGDRRAGRRREADSPAGS